MSKIVVEKKQPLGGSKIGRKPILFTQGIEVKIKDNHISIKGPKGELHCSVNEHVSFVVNDNMIYVKANHPFTREGKAFHGLFAKIIQNMVTGVSEGFQKVLLLVGTGYRAKLNGNQIEMSLGYSHPVNIEIPNEISCKIEENNTKIIIEGIDKEKIGQFAANIKKKRMPEPYKGKGVRYSDEQIKRKAGKSGKSKK